MKNIIYLLILTVFATSCDDWMDVEPKGKVIPSKAEDYRLLLDNTNSWGTSPITETADLDLYVTDDIDLRDDFIGSSYGEYQVNAYQFEDHIYFQTQLKFCIVQVHQELRARDQLMLQNLSL